MCGLFWACALKLHGSSQGSLSRPKAGGLGINKPIGFYRGRFGEDLGVHVVSGIEFSLQP